MLFYCECCWYSLAVCRSVHKLNWINAVITKKRSNTRRRIHFRASGASSSTWRNILALAVSFSIARLKSPVTANTCEPATLLSVNNKWLRFQAVSASPSSWGGWDTMTASAAHPRDFFGRLSWWKAKVYDLVWGDATLKGKPDGCLLTDQRNFWRSQKAKDDWLARELALMHGFLWT